MQIDDSYARNQQHVRDRFQAFEVGFVPGRPASDVVLQTLAGDRVALSDLWNDKPLILEFGAVT